MIENSKIDFYSVASSRPLTHGQISWFEVQGWMFDDLSSPYFLAGLNCSLSLGT